MSIRSLTRSRLKIFVALTSTALLGGLLTVPAAATEYTRSGSMPALVGSVSNVHPTLMASGAEIAATKASVATDSMAAALKERLVSKANTLVTQPVASYDPRFPTRLYDISQTVWDRVTTLGLAWKLTANQAYAERLWSELSNAASFPDWNPGHFLDTATLSQSLGVGYDWLYEYWSPERKNTLTSAIVSKGLIPAADQYQKALPWTKEYGNWNVVSNSGMGMAALSVRAANPSLADSVLNSSLASLQSGLKGYAPDGGYREGYQYWTYATQHLVQFATSLKIATGSDQGLLSNAGVRASSMLPFYLTGSSGEVFNYSDSKPSVPPPALFVMGREYGNGALTKLAYDTATKADINQFAVLWYKPNAAMQDPAIAKVPLDKYFRGAEVSSMRSAWTDPFAASVAVKAATSANNGHPHLDGGSFVLDALGVNWASELGPDSYALPGYTDGLVNGARWSYYRTRAEGSNTMVFGAPTGADQDPYANSVMEKVGSSPDKAFTVANLTSTNPATLNSWKRGVALVDNRQQVVIQDEIAAKATLDSWWFMHTKASIDVAADGRSAILTREGKQVLARITSSGATTFSVLPATPLPTSPNPTSQGANSDYQRLAVRLTGAASQTLAVQFSPLRPGLGTPPAQTVTPLSSWSVSQAGTASELSSIAVNGSPLRAFMPASLAYDVESSPSSAVPKVTASGPAGSTVAVSQATSLPGTAKISVSQPGKASTTYQVRMAKGAYAVSTVTATGSLATAKNTVDGDPFSKWVVGGNQTIKYDLGTARNVSAVVASWASNGPTQSRYAVKTSLNGTDWVTQGFQQVPATTAWTNAALTPRSARYVAIDVDSQNLATRYAGIYETKILADPPVLGRSLDVNDPVNVTLSPLPGTANVGDSGTLAVVAKNSTGAVVDPSKYTRTYVSSKPNVGTVDAGGKYRFATAGETRLGVLITGPNRRILYASSALTVKDPWRTTLSATADTYVHGSTANRTVNFGTSAGLLVKQSPWPDINREAYLRFSLAGHRNAQVVKATLTMHMNTSDTNGINSSLGIREVLDPWSESAVTYATKPRLGSLVGSTAVDNILKARTIDVTSYIQRMSASGSDANFGLTQVVGPTESGLLVFVYGKDSPKRPQLEITTAYKPPTG